MYYLDANGGPLETLLPVGFTNANHVEVTVDNYSLPTANRIALGIWTLQVDDVPDPRQSVVVGSSYADGPSGLDQQPSVKLKHWQTRPLTSAEQQGLAAADKASAIAIKSQAIDDKVTAMFAGGFAPTGAVFQGKTAQLDQVSQDRIGDAGSLANFALVQATLTQVPATFSIGWIMTDNTTVTLTASEMADFANQAAAQVQKWIYNARLHKNNLTSLTDAAAVQAYDFSGGW